MCGQKCTHRLTHPNTVVVFDEFGANTHQKSDSGAVYIVGRNGERRKCYINTKEFNWTMLGITTLGGKSVMNCFIFSGGGKLCIGAG